MWGIKLYQLLSFGRQFGLAVMGAAALWGMVFLYLAHTKKVNDTAGVFLSWIALRMRWLILAGGFIAVSMWLILTLFVPTYAHEGVTLVTTEAETINAMLLMAPLYLGIIGILLFLVLRINKPSFLIAQKYGFSWFYPLVFILSSVGISYYTDLRGLPLNEIIFHIFQKIYFRIFLKLVRLSGLDYRLIYLVPSLSTLMQLPSHHGFILHKLLLELSF